MREFLQTALFLAGVVVAVEYDVENGKLSCDVENCELECDYGFVALDKRFYPLDEPELESKAFCVETMAFLVGGHDETEDGLSMVEIVSSNESLRNINVQDFVYPVQQPVVLWTEGRVLVCGGYNAVDKKDENRCYEYNACANEWVNSNTLNNPRSKTAGVVTYDDHPWILGGMNGLTSFKSSELGNTTTGSLIWALGPCLDSGKSNHCAVTRDNGRVAVVTGGKNSMATVETFYADDVCSHSTCHTVSTEMLFKRSKHVCSTLPSALGNGEAILVAGGANEFGISVNSVEVWDPNHLQPRWEESAELITPTQGAGMAILDGKPTIMGGKNFNTYFDSALAFNFNLLHQDNGQWEPCTFTLKRPRGFFGVTEVPVTLFDKC